MRSRDWPDLRWPAWKIRAKKMWVPGCLLLSESFIFLRKIARHWQRCEVATFCDRAEVYIWHHRSVTWPNPKITKNHNIRLEWGVNHATFHLSIANASGAITRKLFAGWHQPPPPRSVSVKRIKKKTSLFNGGIHRDRAIANQSLLGCPCPLPTNRVIFILWQNLESGV